MLRTFAIVCVLLVGLAAPRGWCVDAITLLSAVTVDTTSSTFTLPLKTHTAGSDQHHYSVFVSSSDFGSGTVTIELSVDGGSNWFTARSPSDAQASFTQSDHLIIETPRSGLLRARLNGSTSPSALTVQIL